MLLQNDSGEKYEVEFAPLLIDDVKNHMKNWDKAFDWTVYFGKPGVEVYKMVIKGNDTIQGAIALEIKEGFVHMHLIESAPHNRVHKQFDLVGEHLFAFACLRSRSLGFEGFVFLEAKTRLIMYYSRNMHAKLAGGRNMIVDDLAAERLIRLYLEER